jgi:hypothetical protein
MLDTKTIKSIEEFVAVKPRSLQEISLHIKKSWRTTDRYVDEIGKEFGTIDTRTFREGTRGALKIVYWASVEKAHSSVFQERLEHEIELYKRKEDFFAFDIYQHIADKNKRAVVITSESEDRVDIGEWIGHIQKTNRQLLIFSGNLSWINLGKNNAAFAALEECVKKKVSVKMLVQVDLSSMKNIEKALSLNFKHNKEYVEIRHCEQPVRAFVFDDKLLRVKEVKEPSGKMNELSRRLFIYYEIKDKEWVDWITRVFWKLFSNSIDAKKRIEELQKLKVR